MIASALSPPCGGQIHSWVQRCLQRCKSSLPKNTFVFHFRPSITSNFLLRNFNRLRFFFRLKRLWTKTALGVLMALPTISAEAPIIVNGNGKFYGVSIPISSEIKQILIGQFGPSITIDYVADNFNNVARQIGRMEKRVNAKDLPTSHFY